MSVITGQHLGAWMHTGDPVVATTLARAGFDYVVVDLQHGSAQESDLPGLCALIARQGCRPMVRARSRAFGDIGRPLDLGAKGVIVPSLQGVADARDAVRACTYPPSGERSQGDFFGDDESPWCILMVESARAVEELDETLTVDGVDGIYVGPADLSRSLGQSPSVVEQTSHDVVRRCLDAGLPVGVHATDGARGGQWRAAGCQLVTVASDVRGVERYAAEALTSVTAATHPDAGP